MKDQSKKVYGYKDTSTRVIYISLGVLLLIGFNMLFIVWVKYPNIKRIRLVLLLVAGWVFWRVWRILMKLHYIIDKKSITIVTPLKKKFVLPRDEIESIEENISTPWWYGWGIYSLPWRGEVYFTTCSGRVTLLRMKDGKKIYVSPKKSIL